MEIGREHDNMGYSVILVFLFALARKRGDLLTGTDEGGAIALLCHVLDVRVGRIDDALRKLRDLFGWSW